MALSNISSVIPDWSREKKALLSWDPSRSLLASIRSYQKLENVPQPFRFFGTKLTVLRHRFWSIITGADIPLNCQLGGGLLLPHPNGIVIHPGSRVGPNCLIFQQVTIGGPRGGLPIIGGNVDIGAGAKILGNVRIGEHALIGANAVIVKDVPANCVAIGVPAVVSLRT